MFLLHTLMPWVPKFSECIGLMASAPLLSLNHLRILLFAMPRDAGVPAPASGKIPAEEVW